ncbi:hypothetical protein D0Y65_011589 [Glycine soja]|uniref:Secreted protein n=2 Tax=Glycine subgen. Soja TaxID=1462606 RepID=A0A0R0K144_SOYBN|nr:hypothetical protein D0Y65_011589 [Glycine soja]
MRLQSVQGLFLFLHVILCQRKCIHTWNPELVKRIGAATTLEVRDTATQYVYSPCIPHQQQNSKDLVGG